MPAAVRADRQEALADRCGIGRAVAEQRGRRLAPAPLQDAGEQAPRRAPGRSPLRARRGRGGRGEPGCGRPPRAPAAGSRRDRALVRSFAEAILAWLREPAQSPSPTRLTASTVAMTARPGATITWGAVRRTERPSAIMAPQLATFGSPSPGTTGPIPPGSRPRRSRRRARSAGRARSAARPRRRWRAAGGRPGARPRRRAAACSDSTSARTTRAGPGPGAGRERRDDHGLRRPEHADEGEREDEAAARSGSRRRSASGPRRRGRRGSPPMVPTAAPTRSAIGGDGERRRRAWRARRGRGRRGCRGRAGRCRAARAGRRRAASAGRPTMSSGIARRTGRARASASADADGEKQRAERALPGPHDAERQSLTHRAAPIRGSSRDEQRGRRGGWRGSRRPAPARTTPTSRSVSRPATAS